MAVDLNFFKNVVWDQLPTGWFDPDGEVIKAVVAVLAEPAKFSFDQLASVAAQTRLASSSGIFLEAFADDYFGKGLYPRREAESDAGYRVRIGDELLRPRGTREAMRDALADLTGFEPTIFEPSRMSDAGHTTGKGDVVKPKAVFYGRGRRGSYQVPFQVYISVRRPVGPGNPNRKGYGKMAYGYDARGDSRNQQGAITDFEIYQTIKRTLPAGVTAWVTIQNGVN